MVGENKAPTVLQPCWRALDRNVVAVAIPEPPHGPYCWKAFIGAVAGESHDREWTEVRDRGTRLDAELARVIFPRFAKLPYDDR